MRLQTRMPHNQCRGSGGTNTRGRSRFTSPCQRAQPTSLLLRPSPPSVINHGLTRALQKAFAKRGWSTDQMREFVTNFQKKHRHQVPMPKIYGDEDSTDDEGPELADGTKGGQEENHRQCTWW